MRIKSLKVQLSVFLFLFAGYLAVTDKDYFFLLSITVAIAATVFTDSLFCYFKNKKITVTESSIVSGLIIGFVLSPDTGLWLPAVAGIIAIFSKHILRWRKNHFLNPAAFGVLFSLFIFGFWFDTGTQWNGTYLWYFLVPAGIYFSYKMRKLEIIAGYYIVYFCCFGIQAFLQEMPISTIAMFANYFFILIMLVEPKTSPYTRWGKIIYGASAAVIVFVLYFIGFKYDADLAALMICNAGSPLLNKLK